MAQDPQNIVLVTGASGFIAGHIVKLLLLNGYNVRGTVRSLKNASTKYAYLYALKSLTNNKLELCEADLTKDEGWNEAVQGCSYVIHTASPVMSASDNPNIGDDYYVKPAVNGTKRVLNACLLYKNNIKKFVYTSSIATCKDKKYDDPNIKVKIYSSDMWTDPNMTTPYGKSKTLAEMFLWNFIKEHNNPFECVTILPGITIGPLLTNRKAASLDVVLLFMNGTYPSLPRIQFDCVDVRDVALAHVNALKSNKCNGKRYVLSNTPLWAGDVGILLKDKYGNNPIYNMTTDVGSDLLWKCIGAFNNVIHEVVTKQLRKIIVTENMPSQTDLNIKYYPINKSIIDTAESLIKYNFVTTVHPSRRYIVKTIKGAAFIGGIATAFYLGRSKL